MKISAMKLFKKSSQICGENQNKKDSPFASILMKWFKKDKVERDESSQLQKEENVVPKTEITSRQTLDNINLALAGESSGETSGIRYNNNKDVCKNKYCCGIRPDDSKDDDDELDDNCDDESIINHKSCKTNLIENLRVAAADNGAANATAESLNDETKSSIEDDKVPIDSNHDNSFQPITSYSGENLRFYLRNFQIFTSVDNKKTVDDEKSDFDYQILSHLEHQLDESRFSLMKCKIYNTKWRQLQERFGLTDWKYEDFRDNDQNLEMSDDTRTIKDFYNLNIYGCLIVHYLDIVIETGKTVEKYKKGCMNFLKWLFTKGKEIKEKHKVKTSWIKTILEFFRELSK